MVGSSNGSQQKSRKGIGLEQSEGPSESSQLRSRKGAAPGLERCLEGLSNRKGSVRELALSLINDALLNSLHHKKFFNKYSITLLHHCLNSIKRGSSTPKEITLASQVIGLMALSIGNMGEDVLSLPHEILELSFPDLSYALLGKSSFGSSSDSDKRVNSFLDCLAIVTFVGGDPDEIERSMQTMWQFIIPESKSSRPKLASAISAWTFLLTFINGWRVHSKFWQQSTYYFSNLVRDENDQVRVASSEALSLISEIGYLNKFSTNGSCDGLKEQLVSPAKIQTSVKIGRDLLNISMWSQSIKINFVKRFLGGGFVKHMKENEFLQHVFHFTPEPKQLHPSFEEEQQSDFGEEEALSTYTSEVRKQEELCGNQKYPSSALSKARTQLLNKQRMLSHGRNNGHFAVSEENGFCN
ncbi:PREDICTED: uncharacterized protein LOC104610682 [Nelumbo nucifera]|uniref:Uncharacterized protein LOC104610682 n=2 Tax=Nelumbo nucifera TaxID=4432 RepID=A0A1U8B4C2_NELNU|nr:PREDICTED: uncharacterized protein LOC104610682 [Nelumbo nucifera]DAD45182.1 TPA_asm: hypothetical protein HUJ06_003412 [Nelumbo nucifera]